MKFTMHIEVALSQGIYLFGRMRNPYMWNPHVDKGVNVLYKVKGISTKK